MTEYVYAGASQFAGNGEAVPASGLCRQAVGESDWQVLRRGLPERAEIRAIVVHPDDPRIVYVGTQHGPYRSTDRGEHWQRLDFPDPEMVVWSLLFRPGDPQVMYCGTTPAAVYRSVDAGEHWERLRVDLPSAMVEMGFPCRIIDLAADPHQPETVYAGLEVGGVIRSLDGGDTWRDCTEPLLAFAARDHLKSRILSDTDAEGMLDIHAVTVSPAQPATVFLATRMGLFQSTDRAESWTEMEIWRASPLVYARDVRTAPTDPNTLYAALSPGALTRNGSVYRSEDVGRTWHRLTRGVSVDSTMMRVALSRHDPAIVYGGTRKGHVLGTSDGGTHWHVSRLPAGCRNVYALACG